MSVSTDILRTWRSPRRVLRRRLAADPSEGRALAVLLAACVLIFVAQWPRLAREAYIDPSLPFDARLAGALFGWVLLAPLAFYLLSLVALFFLRLLHSRATGYAVRLAMFWGLLAATPAFLAVGLVTGFVGEGPGAAALGVLTIAALLCFWGAGLLEATREAAP